jgi:tol-pal system protein YbgF
VRKTLLLTGLASLAACSSLTPIDDPVYLRINDLEARLIRIERVLENESLVNLATDISTLRTEVQSLRGEIETLNFEQQGQGSRQSDLYVDLDQRLTELETARASLGASTAGPAAPACANDQQVYDAAFALVQQQNFPGANTAFQSFLANCPTSELRGNAQYWLAESLYGQLSFQPAIAEFQRVIDSYPESAKVPDSMLKIGYSQFEMRNFDAARETLNRVVREFPGTPVARFAEQKLREIPR